MDEAKQMIRDWRARCRKPYVAWSTGKDSTVMLWLILQIDPDIEVIYFDADSALPESKDMLRELPEQWGFRLRIVKTRPILDTLAEYGLDHPNIEYYTMRDTVVRPVRQLIKEGYDGVAVGIRAEESRQRRWATAKYRGLWQARTTGMHTVWPVARWTARDIWATIVVYDLPYNAAYDKTAFTEREKMRVSYWAGETGRTYGRYAWLRYYYPKLWAKLCERVPGARAYG